jgi:hypothetical protein
VTSDAELCARLRAGERSAVRELLDRDHAVAVFFARVIAERGDPERVVTDAWERLFADIAKGTVTEGLRASLLRGVAAGLESVDAAGEGARPERLGTFTAEGDRWEGWWKDEPPPWPNRAVPRPEQVLGALRRLSPKRRTVLVLRDVARLTATEVAAMVDGVTDLAAFVGSSREAYLVELDREVGNA